MAWSSGFSTCGLNQPSMEVVMKFEAMRKIRMPGTSDRARKVKTSFALNLEPMIFCRRSKESLIRLRKSRTRSSRKTTRLRLKRKKTIRLEANGIWGARMPTSNTVATTSRTRIPAMIRRLRLRFSCSSTGDGRVASGITGSAPG